MLMRVDVSTDVKLAADTWFAMMSSNLFWRTALYIVWNGGCPLVSCLDLIRSNMFSLRFGNKSGVLVVPRPAWKYQSLSWWSTSVPRLGFTMFDVKIVAGALALTYGGRVLSRFLMMLSGSAWGLYAMILCSGISKMDRVWRSCRV